MRKLARITITIVAAILIGCTKNQDSGRSKQGISKDAKYGFALDMYQRGIPFEAWCQPIMDTMSGNYYYLAISDLMTRNGIDPYASGNCSALNEKMLSSTRISLSRGYLEGGYDMIAYWSKNIKEIDFSRNEGTREMFDHIFANTEFPNLKRIWLPSGVACKDRVNWSGLPESTYCSAPIEISLCQ